MGQYNEKGFSLLGYLKVSSISRVWVFPKVTWVFLVVTGFFLSDLGFLVFISVFPVAVGFTPNQSGNPSITLVFPSVSRKFHSLIFFPCCI